MMRIRKDDFTNMYFVTSADWETTIVAKSFDEAASKSLISLFEEYGKSLSLSPAIIVVDMTNYSLNFSEAHSKIYSTSMILSDIGMHDLSKKFKNIIEG